MNVELEPGLYVLAVSGGVDSMVLMDMMSKDSRFDIIVAHFDHGIRPASGDDASFVRQQAENYGFKFELAEGHLGKTASEEVAREARYDFFNSVLKKYNARAIVTAHHQDDLIETAFINILRGTGPRGLTAIMRNKNVLRPLLNRAKSDIVQYAKDNKIEWRDDETNDDMRYLRNYIRRRVMPKLSGGQREEIIKELLDAKINQEEIDDLLVLLENDIFPSGDSIDRQAFVSLSFAVATEVMLKWLRQKGVRDLTRQNIESLAMAVKTAKPNSRRNIKQNQWLIFDEEKVRFYTNTFKTG